VSPVSIALWVAGVALVAVGYSRARAPWSRYRMLRDQQANVARYEAWRGGVRTDADGPTGASVAMADALRQARVGALIGLVGFVLIFVGFFAG